MMSNEYFECALGDITELVIDYRGKTPKKLGGEWSNKGYRAISAKNVKTGSIVSHDTIRYVDKELYEKWMKEEVEKGDIIITSEAPFGEVFYWDSDEKIVLSQRLFCVRLKNNVFSKYIYYYMTTNEFQYELDSKATGTTVRGLRQPMLLKCKVKLPKFETQEKIANILSSLDAKIANNKKTAEKLEEIAQTLFNRWFVEFNFPDENGLPYKDNGGEMVESELGLIPKGWEVGNISDIGEVVGGSTPSTKQKEFYEDGTIPWLSPKDLSGYNNIFISEGNTNITEKGYKSCSTKMLPKNSILYTSRAPIGYIAINSKEVCTNQGFKSIVPKNAFATYYLYFYMKKITPEIINEASGSTFKEISGKNLSNKNIIVANNIIIEKFYDKVIFIFEEIYNFENQNRELKYIKNTLLSKLMSGEFEV